MKRMLTSIVLWFLASVVLSLSVTVEAKVVYVQPGGNDNYTGLSWDQAKLTVQAGLNTAGVNDQVWVAAGTYNERITLKADVALYGGFAGMETDLSQRNIAANPTILDGQQGGSVVTSPTGADNTTRIDGFTIKNGIGTLANGYLYGGGIYCNSSSPTISNNTISGNSANNAVGGGIYCNSSSPTISNNTISGNNNTNGYGGGIFCDNSSSPTISNNLINGNIATYTGGGIDCRYSSPTINNNTIRGNSTNRGGGIYCYYSSPTISNNTISGNIATNGSGIYCQNSSPTIANNIIAVNGTGIYKYPGSGTPVLRNNCVFNLTYDYSGLSAGTTDIQQDPLFVSLVGSDFHLTSSSPCINAGNDTDVQAGWLDMDGQIRIYSSHVDIGADEFYPAGDCDGDGHVTEADLLIVLNSMDISAGDTGYDGRADLDGDGSITSTDISIVLTNME